MYNTTVTYRKHPVEYSAKVYCGVCGKRYRTKTFKSWFTHNAFNRHVPWGDLYQKVKDELKKESVSACWVCAKCDTAEEVNNGQKES